MYKSLSILVFTYGTLNAINLGMIDIEANDENKSYLNTAFEGVFQEPDYYENIEHVDAMPSQKRLTTEESLFIPGVQGDPIKGLQSLSGITNTSDRSGDIFIYGSKPEESITTINHLPIGYLFHMGGLHSVIAPGSIDQIDAYLAGFDSTYGNAMGGVINVTPKYPDNDLHGYGHMGIYDASAGVNIPINNKLSFYLGARRSYYDLTLELVGKSTGTLDEDTKTTYTEFPNYYDITFLMKYQENMNNIYSVELISAGDSLNIASQENQVKDPEASGNIKSSYGFTTLGFRHQGYYKNYETNTLLYTKYEYQDTELFDGYFVKSNNYTNGLYHQSTMKLNSHKLIVGFEFENFITPIDLNISQPPSNDDPDYDFTTAEKYRIDKKIITNSATLFVEDIYSLTDSLTLRYGGRLSATSYNNLGAYFDPRLSILKSINESNNISFSTGIYTQIPQGYKTLDEIGNPRASYEHAEHYIIHYDNSYLENTFFSIDGYYKDYKDMLISDSSQNYLNEGKGYSYGVDANIKIRTDNYYGFIAYTYLNSKRQLETDNDTLHTFYGDIPHTLQVVGGMKIFKDYALSTRINYHSGAPYTKVVGTYTENISGRIRPIYEDPFNSRLPDYFTLNVKIAQEIKYKDNSSFEWSFEIMNITNHDNISRIKYDDNYNQVGHFKQMPLQPWFDMTYKF